MPGSPSTMLLSKGGSNQSHRDFGVLSPVPAPRKGQRKSRCLQLRASLRGQADQTGEAVLTTQIDENFDENLQVTTNFTNHPVDQGTDNQSSLPHFTSPSHLDNLAVKSKPRLTRPKSHYVNNSSTKLASISRNQLQDPLGIHRIAETRTS
jgi:hypothetical protein